MIHARPSRSCASPSSRRSAGSWSPRASRWRWRTRAPRPIALVDGRPDFDAWVTIDPWPDMVDVGRQQAQQSDLFGPPDGRRVERPGAPAGRRDRGRVRVGLRRRRLRGAAGDRDPVDDSGSACRWSARPSAPTWAPPTSRARTSRTSRSGSVSSWTSSPRPMPSGRWRRRARPRTSPPAPPSSGRPPCSARQAVTGTTSTWAPPRCPPGPTWWSRPSQAATAPTACGACSPARLREAAFEAEGWTARCGGCDRPAGRRPAGGPARGDRSMRRWAAGLAVVGLLAAGACSSGGDDDVRVAPDFGDPGDCTVIDLSVSSEKVALMTDLAKAFNDSDEAELDDGCLFARPQSKASGAATTLLATELGRGARGPAAGHLVAGVERLGCDPQPAAGRRRRAGHGPRGRAVHADAAGHRHAQADGRRPRLPRHPGRLGGHPAAGAGATRAGPPTTTPSGARSGSARRTRTSRPAACRPSSPRPTRRPARRAACRRRTSTTPRPRRFATGRGVGGRPLRRHHRHVPQQLVPDRPRGHVAHLRLGRGRRGEVGHRLQRGQPRRRPRPRRAAHASPASRSSPSTRRRARSTRTTRSSCSTPRG